MNRGPSGGGHPPSRQQVRARQAALAIGAIVMLILIVIAFRGCLNARSDRAFENYVSDLSSITADSNALSSEFFSVLDGADSGNQSDIGLSQTLSGDTGTSQGLLDRAEGLDAPDEVSAAQEQIELAFELRHDAIEGIANQVDQLNGDLAEDAVASIYTQMKVLSASDILYARARDQIDQALTDAEVVVAEGIPDSQFLPDPGKGVPDYLNPDVVESAFTGAAGSDSASASNADCQNDGLAHGTGLVDGGSLLQPSGTALTDGGAVTAPAGDDSIEVSVQNQGDADESGIDVSITSDTGLSGTDTIDQIAPGETETATIRLQPAPQAGETVTIDVEVATVGCEQVDTNNAASYPITF